MWLEGESCECDGFIVMLEIGTRGTTFLLWGVYFCFFDLGEL